MRKHLEKDATVHTIASELQKTERIETKLQLETNK